MSEHSGAQRRRYSEDGSHRRWREVIPTDERAIFKLAGAGQQMQLGTKPAVLVIDVTYAFTGRRGVSIAESVREYPRSCGEYAWAAIPAIKSLLRTARGNGIPCIYSTNAPRRLKIEWGRWGDKSGRLSEPADANEIVKDVRPSSHDLIIEKSKPSIFFGTALTSLLISMGVDTLFVVGGTTSGCVRASVVDGFSYNYRVVVVADATFDRCPTSHLVSLFDMEQKYAQIVLLREAYQLMQESEVAAHKPRPDTVIPGGSTGTPT